MQYKLLASDFDNTLVPFGEPCPRPAVVKAVKKMQAAGGKFVLSTGRGYCVINKQQLGGIRFDYAITNNGACVVDRDGAIIAEHPMTNEEMYAPDLQGRRGSGPPSHRYAPCRLCLPAR